MVTKKNLIVAIILIACGIAAFFIFFPSDEAKIKKRFNGLSEQIKKDGKEHEIVAAAAARQVENMFAPSVLIEIESYSVSKSFPKGELSPHVLYARAQYRTMELTFKDFNIQFPDDASEKIRANVSVTAVFKAETSSSELVDEIHEIECTLQKIEDEWFFSGIRQVEVLER